jgi:hypothetical protein
MPIGDFIRYKGMNVFMHRHLFLELLSFLKPSLNSRIGLELYQYVEEFYCIQNEEHYCTDSTAAQSVGQQYGDESTGEKPAVGIQVHPDLMPVILRHLKPHSIVDYLKPQQIIDSICHINRLSDESAADLRNCYITIVERDKTDKLITGKLLRFISTGCYETHKPKSKVDADDETSATAVKAARAVKRKFKKLSESSSLETTTQ